MTMPDAGTSTNVDAVESGSSEDAGSLDEWLREEEDDTCVCRICRMPAESDTPLFHPCRCSGSIKFVHEPCLIRWLEHSGKVACEVCGHEFSFTPVYAEDAPSQLPLMVLLWGTVKKGLSAAVFLQRALMVWLSWLVILPVTTCFMWRISFSPTHLASSVIQSRMSPMALLFDCIQGSLLTAFLFILMMMLTYIKDHFDTWIARLEEHFAGQLRRLAGATAPSSANSDASLLQMNIPNVSDSGRDGVMNENNDVMGGAQGSGSRPANPSESVNESGNKGQDFEWDFRNVNSIGKTGAGEGNAGRNDSMPVNAYQRPRWAAIQHTLRGWMYAYGEEMEELLNWLEEKLHTRLKRWEEMVQDRLRQWEENIQNHLDQLEERVEERINQFDQPFERVLGLQGPLHNIFLNMSAVILFCGVMIVCCIWVPLRLGLVVAAVSNLSWNSIVGGCLRLLMPSSQGSSPCKWLFSFIQHSTSADALDAANVPQTGEQQVCPVQTFEAFVMENQCFSREPPPVPKHPLHQYSMKILSEVEAQMIPPDTAELAVLLVGWSCILVTTFVLMWLRSAWQIWARDGRNHVTETGVFFSQWLSQTFLGLFVVVKVITVVVLELIVLPAGFGYWLHLCMLPIFKATAFREATAIALLFHWLCGMGFLLGFTSIVHLFREVLRPGALPYLKDPTRPDRDPFGEMASDGFGRQIACWVFSCVLYSVMGVVLLHIPARLARMVCTYVYPIHLLFAQVPVSQLPIDLLLFHMFLPFTVGHFMRLAVRDNLRDWLLAVSAVVGLEEYLLAEEDYQRVGGRRQEPLTSIWSLFYRNTPSADAGGSSGDESATDEGETNLMDEGVSSRTVMSSAFVEENMEMEDAPSDAAGSRTSALGGNQRDTAELERQRGFGVRLGLMGIIWGLSMIVCHIAMLVVPVVLGRGLCMGVFGIPTMPYDLFASYVGILTVCAVLEATRGAVNFGAREDVRLVVHDGVVGILSTLKVIFFGVCWVGCTAFAAGLLVEIVQRPIKMLSSGTLVPINLFKAWGSGVILLLMWHVRVSRLQRANPQGPVPDNPWNQEIAALHRDGLWGMNLGRTIQQLVLPVLSCLLIALTCPLLSCKVLQYMFYLPKSAHETIELHSHLVFLVGWILWKLYGQMKRAVIDLEMSIRDDHYLVRQELNNFNQPEFAGRIAGDS